jgi:hypothetical protein
MKIDCTYIDSAVMSTIEDSLDIDLLLAGVDWTKAECYAVHHGPGTDVWPNLCRQAFCKPIVILITSDALCIDREYNWYQDSKPLGLLELEKICSANPDKTFLLLTEHLITQAMVDVNNLKVVAGPYWWNGLARKSVPMYACDKMPNQYSYVMCNNDIWWHRVGVLSYLLARQLDRMAFITASDVFVKRCQQFEHIYNFLTYTWDRDVYEYLDQGYQRLIQNSFNRSRLPPFGDSAIFDNIRLTDAVRINGEKHLAPIRQQTRLEIVTGTLFGEPGLFVTEKELQAVYGCNFLIHINCTGTVQYLRDLGIDTFDDVINHEYDRIKDPGVRLLKALDDNLHLLDGSTDLDKLWQAKKDRFANNCLKMDEICKQIPNQIYRTWNALINQEMGKAYV